MSAAQRRCGWLLAVLLVLTGFVSAQTHESIPDGYQLPLPPAYEGQ